VVNTSATLPSAVRGVDAAGRTVLLHVADPLGLDEWVVEMRHRDGTGPDLQTRTGGVVRLPGDVRIRFTEPYLVNRPGSARLWRAVVSPPVELTAYLARYGRPIEYSYLRDHFPLEDYQTVYANEPGSAEMASAGRPFTAELLVRLLARGVTVAPVVLHAGVSSPDASEPPMPERFDVPPATARLVTSARAAGSRVVAVGTTVVRALETATSRAGVVRPMSGWTDLVLGPERPARAVTGLVTGLHAPEASHLLLLEAVAGPELVDAGYRAALQRGGYLWHEFGDSTLFLPD
jgi:S-adenosylmethionine:tRNA ribosyltransferase-isomerase